MNLSLIDKFIHPDLVIDIGANTGGFYKEAKAVWPDAQFYLVEGNKECSEMLKLLDVEFTISLLSDREKEVTLYTRKGSPCCTGVSYYREQTEFYEGDKAVPNKVHTEILDKIITRWSQYDMWEHYPRVKNMLLKIDTQGSEIDILNGGDITLKQCKAVIIEVSYMEYNQGSPNASEAIAYLKGKGFSNYGSIYEIVHPISRDHIQDDLLFLR